MYSKKKSLNYWKKRLKLENIFISVVIPVFNEERVIKKVINEIPKIDRIEIIIVNDGSTDFTVKKIKETRRNITLLNTNRNVGYATALFTGLQIAKGDIIITMDGDRSYNPKEIFNLIKPIINEQADVVIGSRYLGNFFHVPIFYRIEQLFIENIFWLLWHQKIMDNQSGFKAFKKEVLKTFKRFDPFYLTNLTTLIISNAASYNFTIVEVPITYRMRRYGISVIHILRTILIFLIISFELIIIKFNLFNKIFFLAF